MKNFVLIILLLFSTLTLGQTIYSDNFSENFIEDTTKISGDSIFITVRHFKNEKLIDKTDRVKVRIYAKTTNCFDDNSDRGASLINSYPHGKSTEWYLSGQLKSQGSYTFGKKNLDWKYWTQEGKETNPPKERPNDRVKPY